MKLLELAEATRANLDIKAGESASDIMGAVVEGIRQIGEACDYSSSDRREAVAEVRGEMVSGDYEHLLDVARRYFVLAGEERE